MNTKRVQAAEGVILAALKTRKTAAGVAIALESACLLQSPETAAEMQEWRAALAQEMGRRRAAEEERDRLRAERHSTNEALSKAVERVAELEAAAAKVAEFCADRASYVTSLRNCHPDNAHDYNRWTGHAEARRQLSQLLGLPIGWPAEDTVKPHPSEGELAEQRHLMDPLDHALEALAPRTTPTAGSAL